MIEHRPFSTLKAVKRGWLNARFHFVPPAMGGDAKLAFAPIDAWNDDEVAGQSGFPQHPHQDAEIVTFVREGQITHEDTLGNRGVAGPGEVQAMSAGSGIEHTERNDASEQARLFQIWLQPRTSGGQPHWGMSALPKEGATNGFVVLASGDRADTGAVIINADARVLAARLAKGDTLEQGLPVSGRGYLVPTSGRIMVNGVEIGPRDGCLLRDERVLRIEALDATEIVLVECL